MSTSPETIARIKKRIAYDRKQIKEEREALDAREAKLDMDEKDILERIAAGCTINLVAL